jgi:hypothetical protein
MYYGREGGGGSGRDSREIQDELVDDGVFWVYLRVSTELSGLRLVKRPTRTGRKRR